MKKVKAISRPAECGYQQNVSDKLFCNHPAMRRRYCDIRDFPDRCPLLTCFIDEYPIDTTPTDKYFKSK